MTEKRMRIAINTGGGDAPGLNAVIEAAVTAAYNSQNISLYNFPHIKYKI